MIVADASLLANYLNPAAETNMADAVFQKDPVWFAPSLWRYELQNTLLKYIRIERLAEPRAEIVVEDAMRVIADRERGASTAQVLHVALTYHISAYDAEYVALAQHLHAPLVTFDRRLAQSAPGIAFLPADFIALR